MIKKWDIVSRVDSTTQTRRFTLLIDGSEHDAQLMAKKLDGYAQDPVKAEKPFTFLLALPDNLDETTLQKIRTAVQEGVEQVNKVEEFVPGGVLGNPLFNDTAKSSGKNPQVEVNPEDSFLTTMTPKTSSKLPIEEENAKEREELSADELSSEEFSSEITISERDMLLKDMEDTPLGQEPVEDIFSAETKYDMFVDLEKEAAASPSLKIKEPSAIAKKAPADEEEGSDIFDNKIKDQTSLVDLEDLNTVTDELAKKDMGFIEHANTDRNLAKKLAQQAKQQQDATADKKQDGSTLKDDLSVVSIQPDATEPDGQKVPVEKKSCALPEEVEIENTTPPQSVRRHSADDPDDLPEITIRGSNVDALEKTFNLETTLSTEVMRTQYEKSFRTDSSIPRSSGHKVPRLTPKPPAAKSNTQLHLRKEDTLSHHSLAPTSGEATMEEHEEGQTFFRIRRKQSKSAPSTPPPPKSPANPPASKASQPQEKRKQETNRSASAEQNPAIDHSIELPISELKKHNWPLEIPLLPTYTLENLVLSVNRFAHATAISVIDNPGKMYNPLVFHGATGTGKTHFLNAMAYGFSKKYGQENVFITNGVRLSRGIQRYVVEGNIEKFEKFMESVKALLIDDIHLLAVNEQNRAHISKLLNTFLKEQKQIVITSKYPPESLEKLEDLIKFRLDSGWISELKPTTGQAHFKIVKTMLIGNGVDLSDNQISQFFGSPHMTLSTIMRSIHRLKVLENLVFPHLNEENRSQADMFEKLLATTGEDPKSAILTTDPASITSISTVGNGEWGRLGFFYPSNSSNAMNWMVYALEQRAKELGLEGGFEIAVRSSYSTENIISSAFKIANLCDNKKLRGAVILGPALTICEPSVRENFYDILTHMLEIMLIRCGIINAEALRLPSTYVKVISELLR